ncbi:MAG: hypothetical protein LKE53_00180 [Oscillospiraceae bacterium]|jgi:hypothetical protein|nr:hypothetical protein [Oscillospiraceae bacterium]MDD3261478.1 hypothetical protein [Oscillospiraceae bacterium]
MIFFQPLKAVYGLKKEKRPPDFEKQSKKYTNFITKQKKYLAENLSAYADSMGYAMLLAVPGKHGAESRAEKRMIGIH